MADQVAVQKIKNVCVIGAGLSGIVTIKELQEKNHKVTCFEKNSDVGGVFSEMGTYDSLLLTVSNYFMAYSDFMPTEERLKFWTRKEYKEYLLKYMDHFNLKPAIHFSRIVISVKKKEKTWEVIVKEQDEERKYKFDSLAICSGQFQKKKMPSIEGMDNFQGNICHSTDYKNATQFRGKKVLCIGMGESSVDMTTEISEVAEKTVLSLRRHPIIAPRYLAINDQNAYNPQSYTVDVFTSRIVNYLPQDLHQKAHNVLFQKYLNSFDPATRLIGDWNIKAGTESKQVITKNERVFNAIIDGKVKVNIGGIKNLTETGVVFYDGSEEEIDTILSCTGFEFTLPFIDLPVSSSRELYKHMFYPDFNSSLALIGFVRPQQGGVPVLAELQARYFALLCSEEKKLPDHPDLIKQIKIEKQVWEEKFSITPHISSLVNYAHFAEDLARCIGCEFKVDPKKEKDLFMKCWSGPLWGIQYRLRGPGSRPEKARQILLEKTPIPYKPSPIEKLLFNMILWIRILLPIKKELKPRFF